MSKDKHFSLSLNKWAIGICIIRITPHRAQVSPSMCFAILEIVSRSQDAQSMMGIKASYNQCPDLEARRTWVEARILHNASNVQYITENIPTNKAEFIVLMRHDESISVHDPNMVISVLQSRRLSKWFTCRIL